MGPRLRGPSPRRRRVSPGPVVAFVLATAWLVVVIAPIYYMVLASFRSQGSYLTANPWLPQGGLTLSEYGTVFGAGLGRYLVNSVIITVVCLVLTLSFCLAAAFRIVRRTGRPRMPRSASCCSAWPSRSRPSSCRST